MSWNWCPLPNSFCTLNLRNKKIRSVNRLLVAVWTIGTVTNSSFTCQVLANYHAECFAIHNVCLSLLQNHTATHHLGEQLTSNSRSSKRTTPPKTPNQYICMYCTKEVSSMDALQLHFQTKHGKSSVVSFHSALRRQNSRSLLIKEPVARAYLINVGNLYFWRLCPSYLCWS